MPIELAAASLRKIFPTAPQAVIDAFDSPAGQAFLAAAGITANATRLATAFAHCTAETSGFSIPNLTENINYSAERLAVVFPNRFNDAFDVRAKYGTAPGWQKKAFDDIYGNRMGNRPGTSDGSLFIGRGGPQITGRDGYREVGRRCGLDLEKNPQLACLPENQPRILAAFWSWKNLNPLADTGGVDATVRPWNGGTNGLADRKAAFARIYPQVARLPVVDSVAPTPVVNPPPPVAPAPVPPPVPAPAVQSALAKFIAAILSLFKRK